jgi:DNA-binding NarL/FixJ family response regulator
MKDSNKPPIRVLLVDDQVLFASSLRLVFENTAADEFVITGIAANGRECLARLAKDQPHVILMDVYMPEMDGVEATAAVHAQYPDIKIMMLTTFDDDIYVKNALKAGASGYVLKSIDAEELITCVRAVHQGMLIVSPSVGFRYFVQKEESPIPESVARGLPARVKALQERFPELKPREAEILELILQGNNNNQIADLLFIAEQTVRNYVSSIYAKLGVDDRLQAIQLFGSFK